MIDISELIRVFGDIASPVPEQLKEQVSEQRVTVSDAANEQLVHSLKQEVEHLRTLVSAQESHIDSLKQSLQLLEHKKDVFVEIAERRCAAGAAMWFFHASLCTRLAGSKVTPFIPDARLRLQTCAFRKT